MTPHPLKILIIDDETDVRDSLRRVLARAGYDVRTLADPAEAVTQLRLVATDLVITDIIMPRLSGVELISSIVKEFPDMRVLAISGGGNFDADASQTGEMLTMSYLTAARNAGAIHVLTKPFDSAELLQSVTLVMGN